MWWPFRPRYPECPPETADSHSYDYIVIGGGTAGCVVASRLSEDLDVTVLLLERGQANDTWMSRVPLVSSNIFDSSTGAVSWSSEPMTHCDGRQNLTFRGEVLGGSSRINSMIYTRGSAAGYDAWSAMGHPEWSYEKVLPYFVKSETNLNQPKSKYHGSTGPWITQNLRHLGWTFKAYEIVQKCAEAMGFTLILDMNVPDASCDGLAFLDVTANQDKERMSAMNAFLPRETVIGRKANLTICTEVVVSRIEFANNHPKLVAGNVLFQKASSNPKTIFSAKANREVIVCAGATGSPQVLMLSGIGPGQHLKEHGIEVLRDLPGVGSELTDHVIVPVGWEVPVAESLIHLSINPVKGAYEFFKYVFYRTGILSGPAQSMSLFVRAASLENSTLDLTAQSPPANGSNATNYNINIHNPKDYIPDIELIPLAINFIDSLDDENIGVFSFLATLLRPKSRGTVRLASSSPHERPKIDYGTLSNSEDYAILRKAVRLAMKLGDAMKAQGFPLQRPVNLPESEQDDSENAEMDKFIRSSIRTAYHYSSTCRMAPEFDTDSPGVVDDELLVYGTQNVRVCDASIFPAILACHIQAPVVMVAEKCADLVKAKWAKE